MRPYPYLISSRPARSLSKLSLADAFRAQGVSLKFPSRSRSGIRSLDGAVVLAVSEAEVRPSAEGFCCLLWAPVIEGATEWVDRPSKEERLQHCRLAVLRGGAEGLLARGTRAEVDRDLVLHLTVERRRDEYWAWWGEAALALRLPVEKSRGGAAAAMAQMRCAAM